MKADSSDQFDNGDSRQIPDSIFFQIDDVCSRFEAALQKEEKPPFSPFLESVPAEYRDHLLWEMVALASEYAGRSGPWPNPKSLQPATQDGSSADLDRSRSFGEYDLLSEIGRGGMGIVYRAHQRSPDRYVALKIMNPLLSGVLEDSVESAPTERFRAEPHAAASVEHANIVPIYHTGLVGGRAYYAMRLIDGLSLAKIAAPSPLESRRAARYMRDVADAVAALHAAGIIHRDLKPSNILLDATDKPLVTDFGLAKSLNRDDLTLTAELLGSPGYMSPEQVNSPQSVTDAADVYSLGATLYHLVTGRPPFQAATPMETAQQVTNAFPVRPRQLNPAVPQDIETICLKCLEKDASQRYASAIDLRDELARYLAGQPIRARPVGLVGHAIRWSRRNRSLAMALAGCAFLMMGVTVISVTMLVREARSSARIAAALQESNLRLSRELLARSRFEDEDEPLAALPLLWESLSQVIGTTRERLDRLRLDSILRSAPWPQIKMSQAAPVTSLQIIPNAEQVIGTGSDGKARLWSTKDGALICKYDHGEPIRRAVSSRSGLLLATLGDRQAKVWKVDSGELIGVLRHDKALRDAQFTNDERHLLTASLDETIRKWNLNQQAIVAEYRQGDKAIAKMAVTPSGEALLTFGGNGVIRVWDLSTDQLRFAPIESPSKVRTAVFSSDGKLIAAGHNDGGVGIYDANTGALVYSWRAEWSVRRLEFTPDCQKLVVAGNDAVQVYDVQTQKRAGTTIEHPGLAELVRRQDGSQLLTVGERSVRLWDLESGRSLCSALLHPANATAACFDEPGDRIVTGCDDSHIRSWRWQAAESLAQFSHESAISAIHLVENSSKIATSSSDHTVRGFDWKTGAVVFEPLQHKSAVKDLAMARGRLATCDFNRATIWDLETPDAPKTIPHGDSVLKVGLVDQGKRLVTGDITGGIRLWDAANGQLVGQSQLDGPIVAIATSTEANIVLAAGGHTACLFQASSPLTPVSAPMTFTANVLDAVLSPTGRQAAAFSSGGDIRLINVLAAGVLTRTIDTKSDLASCVFSPDGKTLLTASKDGRARFWDTSTGARVGSTITRQGTIVAACFSGDGRLVALAGSNGSLRVWDVATAESVSIELRHGGSIVHVQFVSDGRLMAISRDGKLSLFAIQEYEASAATLGVMSQGLMTP